MRHYVGALAQKVSTLTVALVLVFSSIAAGVPLLLSQIASAAPGYIYNGVSLNSADWTADRQAPSGGYTVDSGNGRSGPTITIKPESLGDISAGNTGGIVASAATTSDITGNVSESDGEVLAATTDGAVDGTVEEGNANSGFNWWWILPILAAFFFIILAVRRRKDKDEA